MADIYDFTDALQMSGFWLGGNFPSDRVDEDLFSDENYDELIGIFQTVYESYIVPKAEEKGFDTSALYENESELKEVWQALISDGLLEELIEYVKGELENSGALSMIADERGECWAEIAYGNANSYIPGYYLGVESDAIPLWDPAIGAVVSTGDAAEPSDPSEPTPTPETLTELFADIANAIMEKEGSSEPIPALKFAERIRNLSAGGGGAEEDTVPTIYGDIAAVVQLGKQVEEHIWSLLTQMGEDLEGVLNEAGMYLDLSNMRVTQRSDGSIDVNNVTAEIDKGVPFSEELEVYMENADFITAMLHTYFGNSILVDTYTSGHVVNWPLFYPKKSTPEEVTPEVMADFLLNYYGVGGEDDLAESKRFGKYGADNDPVLGIEIRVPLGDSKTFTMKIAYAM